MREAERYIMGLVKRLLARKTAVLLHENEAQIETKMNKEPAPMRRTLMSKRAVIVTLSAVLMLRFKYCLFRYPCSNDGHNDSFQPRPLMVQSQSSLSLLTNITRLFLEQDPPHYIKDRRNHLWINHGVDRHKYPETSPKECVAEAEWMSDHHPSCNDIHQVDMGDFFVPKLFQMIGRGGFRSAFLFHEYNGARRVLKTLSLRKDRDYTLKMMDRMRRDAVASEQLTSSMYIVDIYGYCAQAALVDYSTSDDMLSLFTQKKMPTKDELFQIAHDVAQSVADAHHFNDEGRATIVHMDIKPSMFLERSFVVLRLCQCGFVC